jgi:hypothetical protein
MNPLNNGKPFRKTRNLNPAMKLTHVLEAQRLANPGMRRYHLMQERQTRELNRLWCQAHAPVDAGRKQFLAELVREVSETLLIASASESTGHFTIEFPVERRGYVCPAELVVHIGPEQDHRDHGCWVQVRRHGEAISHRRMMISPKSTPAQIWAKVRHYFQPENAAPVELAEAA